MSFGELSVGEMSVRGIVHSRNCPSGNYRGNDFGELSVGEKFVGEMSVGELSKYRFSYGPLWCGEFIFLWELFLFNEKDFSPLVPVAFVSKCFYHNPCWYFQLIFFGQYAALPKKPANLLYEEKRLKIFFWSYQRSRTPSAKRLSQTPFYRF